MEKVKLVGSEKQVAWAEEIRTSVIEKMEDVIDEIEEKATAKPIRAKYFEKYVSLFREMRNNENASFWIDYFRDNKLHFDVVSGYRRYLKSLGEEAVLQKIFFDINAAEKLHFKNK